MTSELGDAVERDGVVVRFLSFTGLRWGEMAALHVANFDVLRRVNASRSVTEAAGAGLVWSTPKTWERRSVPFPAALVDDLAKLMEGKGSEDLVFGDHRGCVLRNSNWRARVFAPAVDICRKEDETFPTDHPAGPTATPRPVWRSARGPTSRPCSGCWATRRPA